MEVGNEREKNKEKKKLTDAVKLSLRLVTHNTKICAGLDGSE